MISNQCNAKIGIIVPGYGRFQRGVESFANEFSTYLSNDFNIKIFSINELPYLNSRMVIPRDRKSLQPIYRSPYAKRISNFLFLDPIGLESFSFSLRLLPILLREQFDVLIPLNGFWGALTCRIIRAIKNTPFLTIAQSGIGRPNLWQVRQKPNLHIELTEYAQQWIIKKIPNIVSTVIPNGVNLNIFHPHIQPIDLNLSKPVYLCVSALTPYKNINFTVEAFARLKRGSLLLIGDGDDAGEINELGIKTIGFDRFKLIKIPYLQLGPYYAACDAFTLLSKKNCEAFGNVYIEAMACNKPVVATNDNIRKEIIGDAGIFCDDNSIDDYVRKLEEVVQVNFNKIPYEQAQKYSWEIIGKKYQEIINSLC